MNPEELIEEAVGNPAKIRVLRMLKKPGAGFMSVRQLAKVTSINPMTLSRALHSLRTTGIVDYVQAGKSQLWRVVPSYASYVVTSLFDFIDSIRPRKVIKSLLDRAGPVPDQIASIILYGSMASETASSSSDIDLCVLHDRDIRTMKIEDFFDRLRQKIFNELGMRISIMPVNKRRFHLLKEPLKSNIREGIILYEKNKKS